MHKGDLPISTLLGDVTKWHVWLCTLTGPQALFICGIHLFKANSSFRKHWPFLVLGNTNRVISHLPTWHGVLQRGVGGGFDTRDIHSPFLLYDLSKAKLKWKIDQPAMGWKMSLWVMSFSQRWWCLRDIFIMW